MHMHISYALIRKSCQRNWACGCVSTTSCATQILSSSIHTATPSAILSITSVFTASLVLALPESHTASPQSPVLPPSPQKPTLGAKLGALFSLRRPARRHTAPTHSGHTRRALESLAGGVGMVEDPDPTSNNNQSKPTHTVPTSSVPPTTPPTTNDPLVPPSDTMISESHPPYTRSHPDSNPPTKANLKAWWNHFTFAQKAKREGEAFSAYRGAFVAFFTLSFLSFTLAADLLSSAVLLRSGQRPSSRFWETIEGKLKPRQRADLYRKLKWRVVRLGVHPRRGGQVVRPCFSLFYS